MAEAKIRSTPDEELQYRSQEVKANNKTVVTPIKSIDASKIHPTVSISKQVNCIVFGLKIRTNFPKNYCK